MTSSVGGERAERERVDSDCSSAGLASALHCCRVGGGHGGGGWLGAAGRDAGGCGVAQLEATTTVTTVEQEAARRAGEAMPRVVVRRLQKGRFRHRGKSRRGVGVTIHHPQAQLITCACADDGGSARATAATGRRRLRRLTTPAEGAQDDDQRLRQQAAREWSRASCVHRWRWLLWACVRSGTC